MTIVCKITHPKYCESVAILYNISEEIKESFKMAVSKLLSIGGGFHIKIQTDFPRDGKYLVVICPDGPKEFKFRDAPGVEDQEPWRKMINYVFSDPEIQRRYNLRAFK